MFVQLLFEVVPGAGGEDMEATTEGEELEENMKI